MKREYNHLTSYVGWITPDGVFWSSKGHPHSVTITKILKEQKRDKNIYDHSDLYRRYCLTSLKDKEDLYAVGKGFIRLSRVIRRNDLVIDVPDFSRETLKRVESGLQQNGALTSFGNKGTLTGGEIDIVQYDDKNLSSPRIRFSVESYLAEADNFVDFCLANIVNGKDALHYIEPPGRIKIKEERQ